MEAADDIIDTAARQKYIYPIVLSLCTHPDAQRQAESSQWVSSKSYTHGSQSHWPTSF
jgi:hypothetical protein